MQTVYISSEAKHAERWRTLRDGGAPIASTWIDEIEAGNLSTPNLAQRRIDQVVFADLVIVYCEPNRISSDSLIEAGAALAAGRKVVCIGQPSNLPRSFINHSLWSEAATIEDALNMPHPNEAESSEWLEIEARKEVQRFVEETDRLIKTGDANKSVPPDSPEKMAVGIEDHVKTLLQLGRFQEAVIERADARVLHHLNELDNEAERAISFSYACDVSRFSKIVLAIAQNYPLASGSLRWAIEEVIESFYRLASTGHKQALSDLCILAIESVQRVKRLTKEMPEAISELAATRPNWPGMIGPHGDIKKENEDIVRTLQIGKNCPRTEKGWSNRPSPGQPFRQITGEYVRRIIDVICAARNPQILFHIQWCPAPPQWITNARALADLQNASAAVVEAWFDVGWEILSSFSEGRPETLPGLEQVGEFRAGVWDRMDATEGQQINQLRAGLRERLRGAFMTRYDSPE